MKKMIALYTIALIVLILVALAGGCMPKIEPHPTTPAPAPPPPTVTTPQEIARIIDEEIGKLPTGTIVYNPPKEMTVGISERVEARISREEFHEELIQGLKGRGVPKVEDIEVGTAMKVRLIGDKFNILSLSDEEQLVASSKYTQWAWDVIPLKAGSQVLHLSVTVIVPIPGHGDRQRTWPVIDKEINVKVNATHTMANWLGNNWQWFISTIIIPIVWKGIDIIKKRKRNVKKQDSEG